MSILMIMIYSNFLGPSQKAQVLQKRSRMCPSLSFSSWWCSCKIAQIIHGIHTTLGVKIRNLKVNFKTGGTWRWVGQWSLIMNIYDFFIRLSRLVTKHPRINKNLLSSWFLFIRQHFVTKWLSRIKNHKDSLSVIIARPDAKCHQS